VLVLIPVLVELASIVLGVHTYMSLHVFVGVALIPAVLLKLASTGWRFARYYTRSGAYVAHGPPQIAMRMLAPLFVAATVVLFGSGVAMGLLHGHGLQVARRLHGPASVIWLGFLGLHVLVYARRALRSTVQDALPARRKPLRGTTARAVAVVIVVVCGLALGGATVPAQHRWVDLPRHHHDRTGARGRPG
jgi:type IV secretory pathway VirB2 component (pilin)